MENDLSNVKTGDYIFTIENGYEKVVLFENNNTGYPVETKDDAYTCEGLICKSHKYPSAFLTNPFDKDDLPPVDFIEGEVIAVRNNENDDWCFRQFLIKKVNGYQCKIEKSYSLYTWAYARKLTDIERGL